MIQRRKCGGGTDRTCRLVQGTPLIEDTGAGARRRNRQNRRPARAAHPGTRRVAPTTRLRRRGRRAGKQGVSRAGCDQCVQPRQIEQRVGSGVDEMVASGTGGASAAKQLQRSQHKRARRASPQSAGAHSRRREPHGIASALEPSQTHVNPNPTDGCSFGNELDARVLLYSLVAIARKAACSSRRWKGSRVLCPWTLARKPAWRFQSGR
jgi:hypothetical protein